MSVGTVYLLSIRILGTHSSKFLLIQQDKVGHFSIQLKPSCFRAGSEKMNPSYGEQGFPMELTPRVIPCCIVRILDECMPSKCLSQNMCFYLNTLLFSVLQSEKDNFTIYCYFSISSLKVLVYCRTQENNSVINLGKCNLYVCFFYGNRCFSSRGRMKYSSCFSLSGEEGDPADQSFIRFTHGSRIKPRGV